MKQQRKDLILDKKVELFKKVLESMGIPRDCALLDKGWVFRTKEEAEAALPKVAAEMGVEYKY